MAKVKTLILGAAGRDFHNFNTFYRDNPAYEVVAFTATQIPDIAGRKYPAVLAGKLYPQGIPIFPESDMPKLIDKYKVDEVVFAYSDVPHEYVMHLAATVNALGPDFKVMGAKRTMLSSKKPVVAITAVRTGSGKSAVTRRVCEILKSKGKKVVAVRHPMPYGDLAKQKVQRFASYKDLDKHFCTIEEREEYEPHIDRGCVVYAGVDYAAILAEAEKEADVVVWDGGNNDLPFYEPNVWIVVADPHRAGHELTYYPGETNIRAADVIIMSKMETAVPEDVEFVRENIRSVNPGAMVIDAAMPFSAKDAQRITGKRVLCIEDGPTLTHGEMRYGAACLLAMKYGAAELVDPRPFVVGTIAETFKKYPDIGSLLPAMGYGDKQVKDLEATIAKTKCDVVVSGTPIDLTRVLKIKQPTVRVSYDIQEIGRPNLEDALSKLK